MHINCPSLTIKIISPGKVQKLFTCHDQSRVICEYSKDFNRPIIDHCEDKSVSEGGQVNEGVVSLELGLRGIPSTAEELIVKRDLDLAQETGGHVHIAHVSTEGSVDAETIEALRGIGK